MTLLWLKALHVAAVIAWMGGMLLLALAHARLVALPTPRSSEAQAWIAAVRFWDRRYTVPAMGLAWALGILTAAHAGFFSAGWLWAKLVFVFLLSALHGVLSGRLARLSANPAHLPAAAFRHAGIAVLAGVCVVAVLVVVKPF